MTTHAQQTARTGVRTLSDSLLEQITSGAFELPLLPGTAADVLSACQDDASGPRHIAEMMHRDPALTAHVLRLANSAAFGSSHSIVSLPEAIGRLGLTIVGEMTLAAALDSSVFKVPRYESAVRETWVHSAAAGAWAREIARSRRRSVEGAFLCGLLHDVGRPILLQAVTALIPKLGRAPTDAEVTSAVDELHATVGGDVVRSWSLPEWMALAIAHHHEPAAAPEHRDEAFTTAFADDLAHRVFEESPDPEAPAYDLALAEELGLYPEDMERLVEHREEVLAVARAMA